MQDTASKPRTPKECPVCGRPPPTPLVGNSRKPGVVPWLEHKSTRGTLRAKTSCTALYRLRTPAAWVALVLLAINLGLTIAEAQLLFGHSQVTIRL
jgi:hypothetical protein